MKSEVVRLRCTADQKARWIEAAGGPRRLSEWITRRLDAEPVEEPDAGPLAQAFNEAIKPSLEEPAFPQLERAFKPDFKQTTPKKQRRP